MINVVVPTGRVGRAQQRERVVGAQARVGKNLRAMWSCLCAAGTATLVFALVACGEVTHLPVTAGTGPSPTLPPPQHALMPPVNIAPAKGGPSEAMPQASPGTSVSAFARDLDHPRWLYVLPNGDVLVAETNAPSKPHDGNGIQGWLTGLVMKRAGAGVPRASRITLLRDADGDGVAELRSVLIESVNSPFGMALVGDQLYVAASDAVLRFPYVTGATRIVDSGTKLVDTVNEPDEFDSDLVPDHLTTVGDGVFFGWPSSHDGRHGSWNRRPQSGYKVIFVPFESGKPSGEAPGDVSTGLLSDDGGPFGRPAGVFLDNQGALLVADDVGNAIWRVASRR